MVLDIFQIIFIIYNFFTFFILLAFCSTRKNIKDILEKSFVKKIVNIFFLLLVVHIFLTVFSTWAAEGTLLDNFRNDVFYSFKPNSTLFDLLYIPSFILVIFTIYIIEGDSWLDTWETSILFISALFLIASIGHMVSNTVIPPFSEISLIRKISFIFRTIVFRSLIFVPFIWYNKMNIKTKELYFTIIIACGLAFITLDIVLAYIYSDFLSETFAVFNESLSFMFFYLVTSVKFIHDIGEENMKKNHENLFRDIIMLLMAANLFSPFILKSISIIMEKNLDLLTAVFTLILNGLILSSFKIIPALRKINRS